MWQELLSAIALVMVLEGLPYFISPSAMRRALAHLFTLPDHVLRGTGLTLMVIGVVLLFMVRKLL
ncbi:DUF2065 domain-containing protein [Thiohalorhabdus methylotrophus]|uniref:DUF2065 domain-containing protein n=1 Tax=Thiohalorhabdus methylotrophus TaxID=3242694 RepID=A0ABV4TZF3_9GAMM